MKFLKVSGILSLLAIALAGALLGFGIYTQAQQQFAQRLVICGSDDNESPPGEQGCFPGPGFPGPGEEDIAQAPFLGWDPALDNIIVIGPNPVNVNADDGDDQVYNTAATGETDCDNGQQIEGGLGNDLLVDNDFANSLFGDDDNDGLFGNGGNDCLNGGDGDDFLSGGAGDDVLDGGDGNDVLIGGPGDDTYAYEDGNDIYIFFAGDATAGTEEIPFRCDATYVFVGFGTTVFPTNEGTHTVTDATGGQYEYTIDEEECPADNPAKIIGM